MTEDIEKSLKIIAARAGNLRPEVAVVLGSGLGGLADAADDRVVIAYSQLPGFPQGGIGGHAGRLVLGRIGGTDVALMQGRAHYYENGAPAVMKTAVRTLAALGCEAVVLTNAAGSTEPSVGPGSIMAITDHINFTGVSPLFGERDDARFVDLSAAYDPQLRRDIRAVAADIGVTLHEGVYMWFCGPHFETPAEIRAARILGADAVGMSTVPEVILARHAGMRVAALSIITNFAAGMSSSPLSHEQTMRNAALASRALEDTLRGFLTRYGE